MSPSTSMSSSTSTLRSLLASLRSSAPRPIRAAVAAALLALGLAPAARADDCHPIRGRAEAFITEDGCASPVGLCVAGTMHLNESIQGTIFSSLDTLVPLVQAGRLAYTDSLVLTMSDGTITFASAGVFDTVKGRVVEQHEIVGGTGAWAGVTGFLLETTLATGPGTFAGEFRGELCRAQ